MNTVLTSITNRFDNIEDAIQAAAEAGNDIFGGYENNIPNTKRVNESLGVDEYLLTESGTVLFIAKFDEQQVLNKLSLHASISDGVLHGAVWEGDQLRVATDAGCVHKSDKKGRRALGRQGIIFVGPSLAAELAVN